MIKIVLWDIDGTLLDFLLAEKNSLKKAFKRFSLGECSDETVELYSKINDKYWKMLERGETTREGVLIGRFEEFLEKENIASVSAKEFCEVYENGLKDTVVFIKGAKETVSALKGSVLQYAVTNGSGDIQRAKLKSSGLDRLFDGVFISEEIGFEKPDKRFFERVFSSIPPCENDEILLVGDSLTSDIKGAKSVKIKSCLFCPEGVKTALSPDLAPDYTISDLTKIKDILHI